MTFDAFMSLTLPIPTNNSCQIEVCKNILNHPLCSLSFLYYYVKNCMLTTNHPNLPFNLIHFNLRTAFAFSRREKKLAKTTNGFVQNVNNIERPGRRWEFGNYHLYLLCTLTDSSGNKMRYKYN